MFEGMIAFIAGLVLLFFGKRMFWLAAALVAFLFGWQLFGSILGPGLSFLLAVVLGGLFAWVAIKFIRIAVYFVGFLAGAIALPYLMGVFGVEMSWLILILIGGAIGLILVAVAFNWGLILITAWAGASAITFGLKQWMTLDGTLGTVIFLVLMVAGIFWQSANRRKS
jgi:hypothetical protein